MTLTIYANALTINVDAGNDMLQIRDGVHETNSSASHSLSIANEEVFHFSFSLSQVRQGKVVLAAQEDGYTRWFRFYRPENILAYLIIAEIESHRATTRYSAFEADVVNMVSDVRPFDILPVMRWNFPVIDSAVSFMEGEYGLEFEFLLRRGETISMLGTGNLQSITGYLSKKECLKALLFGSSSYLETNPQNEYGVQPRYIPTDLGQEDLIADHDEQVRRELQDLSDTERMLEEMMKAGDENEN